MKATPLGGIFIGLTLFQSKKFALAKNCTSISMRQHYFLIIKIEGQPLQVKIYEEERRLYLAI